MENHGTKICPDGWGENCDEHSQMTGCAKSPRHCGGGARVINMTPHPVNILDQTGAEIVSFPSAGQVRLQMATVDVGYINKIRLTKTVYGEPEGLPERRPGTYCIVSQMVKSALPDRKDLLVPSEVVRDDSGRIIGCRSLGR
ncbi:MAG: hypothetical protein SWO11_18890 [Thermodesulfobacteriota bacterium]|nr:hypothetical protein [Thermodesulfobacteriota bacterium]